MSLPIAQPSNVARLALYVAEQASWEGALAAVSTAESGFYASLKVGLLEANKAIRWIRETAISRITEIQFLFDSINFATICYFSYNLAEALTERYAFSILIQVGPWITGAAIAAIVMVGTYFVLKKCYPDETLVSSNNKVDIEKKANRGFVQTSKLVVNIALFIFAKNRLALGIGLLASAYSCFKNSKIKWLSFTREFPIQLHQNFRTVANRLTITYNMLSVPVDKSHENDDCMVCMNKEAEKVSTCARHVLCMDCAKRVVEEKSDHLVRNLNYTRVETKNYTNGRYTHSTWHYDIRMPLENLPNCTKCNFPPLQNSCTGRVNDLQHGDLHANFIIPRPSVDRQPMFEKLNAAYNIVQAGFSYLQTYPELAEGIFKIQKVFIVTDLIILGATCGYLTKRVWEKLNMNDRSTKARILFVLATVTTAVAAGALSYLIVMQLNAYLQSAVVLKDLLQKLPISPELIQNLSANWTVPTAQKFIQCLYVNRIMATVALSFFSKQRALNLISAAAQLFGLGSISSLKFIDFTQNIDWPLTKVLANGGTFSDPSLHTYSLSNFSATGTYMVPSSCAKDPAHMQTIMQSIYDHSNRIFDNSDWYSYWNIYYSYGVETSRTLMYRVTLQNINPGSCGCTLSPSLTDLAMSGYDRDVNRYASFIINYFSE